MKAVRTDTGVSAMKSLTTYEANMTRKGVKKVRTALASSACYEITYKLSSQQARVRLKTLRTDPMAPAMKLLTSC